MKKKSTKKVTTKKKTTKCPNCGKTYEIGAPHYMFCEACTCDVCSTTHSYVISQQDRGEEGMVRVCEDCVMEGR